MAQFNSLTFLKTLIFLSILTAFPSTLTSDEDVLDEILIKEYEKSATTAAVTSSVSSTAAPSLGANITSPRSENLSNNNTEAGKCQCVPFMLCDVDSGEVVKYGEREHLIDMRMMSPCRHYLEICCTKIKKIDKPKPVVASPDEQEHHRGCGIRHGDGINMRIMGGKQGEAQFGEFPWVAAILWRSLPDPAVKSSNVFICEGSLIHPQVVLTAAHCINSKSPSEIKVRLGEWDTQTTNEPYAFQERNASQFILHEEFYAAAAFNDIALIVLEKPVAFAPHIDTICLPPANMSVNSEQCFAAGWGRSSFEKEGEYQVILKKVQLPLVKPQECEAALRTTRLGPEFTLHSSFTCAGGKAGVDTCRGDGGAPLVCRLQSSNLYAQFGIVSWGIGCGRVGIPGVYTDVAKFNMWVHTKVQQLNFTSKYYEDFEVSNAEDKAAPSYDADDMSILKEYFASSGINLDAKTTTSSPPTSPAASTTPQSSEARNSQLDKSSRPCTCVPYFRCDIDSGRVYNHGEQILKLRLMDDDQLAKPAAAGKCHYTEICCEKIKPADEVDQMLQEGTKRKTSCGMRGVLPNQARFRLLGDDNTRTQFAEFPWVAAIIAKSPPEVENPKRKENFICAGSLIHPKVVLTAAHCIKDKDKDEIWTRLGEWDTQTTNEPYPFQERNISQIVTHSDFNRETGFNDIALLILNNEVSLAPNIGLVCLPPANFNLDGARCWATGWGKDNFAKTGAYAAIMKKIDLPIVPRPECQSALRKTALGQDFELDQSFLCAGGEEGKDTCDGDGGAPLVCKLPNSKRYAQAGAVSWGVECGLKGVPAAYTDIRQYVDWIGKQMRQFNLDVDGKVYANNK